MFLVEQTFKIVGELVRAQNTYIAQPGGIMGSVFVLHLLGQNLVVEAVQFQGKEKEVGGNIGDAFLGCLEETGDFWVALVAGNRIEFVEAFLGTGASLGVDIRMEIAGIPIGVQEGYSEYYFAEDIGLVKSLTYDGDTPFLIRELKSTAGL